MSNISNSLNCITYSWWEKSMAKCSPTNGWCNRCMSTSLLSIICWRCFVKNSTIDIKPSEQRKRKPLKVNEDTWMSKEWRLSKLQLWESLLNDNNAKFSIEKWYAFLDFLVAIAKFWTMKFTADFPQLINFLWSQSCELRITKSKLSLRVKNSTYFAYSK